jgi:hypothetical protein
MGDNRPTVGYVVVSLVHGGLSWAKDEKFLCNTDPVAEAFPSRLAAEKAVADTLAYARRMKYKAPGWRRDDHQIIRVVRSR